MITVPLINWQPIANIPEDRKDGRDMLLWTDKAYLGGWMSDDFWTRIWRSEPGWAVDDERGSPIENVRYWADINPPE